MSFAPLRALLVSTCEFALFALALVGIASWGSDDGRVQLLAARVVVPAAWPIAWLGLLAVYACVQAQTRRHTLAGLALCRLLWLRPLAALALSLSGFVFLSTDDVCRMLEAEQMLHAPRVGTWDHIWLAGHFYIQALARWATGDHLAAGAMLGLLAATATAWTLYVLTGALFDRRAALCAVGCYAVLPLPLWLTLSVLPDAFSTLGVVVAATASVLALQRRQKRYQWLACVALVWAGMFRYESYLFSAAFAVWQIVRCFHAPRRWAACLALAALPFGYLALWSYDCHVSAGDALAWYRNWRAQHSTGMEGQWLASLLAYPRLLIQEGGRLFIVLALVGIAASLRDGDARVTERILIAGTALGFVAVMSVLALGSDAISGNVPLRTLLPTLVLLLPFVARLLTTRPDACSPDYTPLRWLLGAALVVTLLLRAADYPNHRGIESDQVAAMIALYSDPEHGARFRRMAYVVDDHDPNLIYAVFACARGIWRSLPLCETRRDRGEFEPFLQAREEVLVIAGRPWSDDRAERLGGHGRFSWHRWRPTHDAAEDRRRLAPLTAPH